MSENNNITLNEIHNYIITCIYMLDVSTNFTALVIVNNYLRLWLRRACKATNRICLILLMYELLPE